MFDSCIYFNTAALNRQLDRIWSKAFKPFDLTPSQAFMLRVTLARPAILQSELAATLNIARATATRTIDTLETRKLLERRSSTNDGRECEIHPTAAAQLLKDRLNQASQDVTAALKAKLGSEEFSSFVTQARIIADKLD